MPDPIAQSLQELERELQQHGLSPEADARILEAMRQAQEPQGRRFSLPLHPGLWAAAALLLVAGASLRLFWTPVEHAPRSLEGLLVLRGKLTVVPGNALQPKASLWCRSKRCQLRFASRHAQIQLRQDARILRTKRQLRVLQGVASLKVQRQQQGPLLIYVSHGIVEVLGTHFTIWQGEDRGYLTLHEGSLRFLWKSGKVEMIPAGRRFEWPKPHAARRLPPRSAPRKASLPAKAAPRRRLKAKKRRPKKGTPRLALRPSPPKPSPLPSPAVAPVRPAPVVLPATPPRRLPARRIAPPKPRIVHPKPMASWLQELERLRSQGRYAQAVRQLHGYIRSLGSRYIDTQERLYFEIGLLLSNYLKQPKKACRHWRNHSRKFPRSSRYQREIQSHLRSLKCER